MRFIHTLLVCALVTLPINASGVESTREQLARLIDELQKSPADDALRGKVIEFAREMKPAPTVSAEAEKFEGRAEYAFRNAKSEADFAAAAREYENAIAAAPWLGGNYFNLGVAQEKAGKLAEAKRSFEWYLKASPDAADAKDVRKRIAGLEFGIEKAATEKKVYDWLLGEWRLNDELRAVGGGAFSPTEAVLVQSVKEGDRIIFRLSGSDFLRATPGERAVSWEHWKPIPYKPIGCPEDGAWNRVDVTSTQKSIRFVFHESFTGTCGHQSIHTYTLSR